MPWMSTKKRDPAIQASGDAPEPGWKRRQERGYGNGNGHGRSSILQGLRRDGLERCHFRMYECVGAWTHRRERCACTRVCGHTHIRTDAHKRICGHTQLRDYALAGRFRRRNIRRVERTDAGNVTGNVTGAGVSSVSGALCRADTGIGIDVGRRIRAGNVCIPGNVEIGRVPAIGNAYPLSGDPRIRILDGE